jgi:hypothetical protein
MTTTFWLLTAIIGIGVMLAILRPSLKASGSKRPVTIILALIIGALLLSFIIYDQIGTPEAIDQPVVHTGTNDGPQNMQDAIVQLEARLQAEPENAEGWVLLGRSYKMVQRFSDAENALLHASVLLPEDPVIMVELAEAMTMASGDPRFSDRAIELLQTAVVWLQPSVVKMRLRLPIGSACWHSLIRPVISPVPSAVKLPLPRVAKLSNLKLSAFRSMFPWRPTSIHNFLTALYSLYLPGLPGAPACRWQSSACPAQHFPCC